MSADMTRLKVAVRRLVKASVEHSWKGSAEANAFADYEKELADAKSAYRRALRLLEQKLQNQREHVAAAQFSASTSKEQS